MNRIFSNTFFFLSITIIISCSSNSSTENVVVDTSLSYKNANQNSNKIFGINGEGIFIKTAPGERSKKLVNEKATKALGEIQYCEIDNSVKVEILETKNDWTKIKVVEPEWLSKTHIGWIQTKFILNKSDEEKQTLGNLDRNEYEIVKTEHSSSVQNFHVLLKHKNFDKNYVYQFVKEFRKENCEMNCNIYVYDSASILPLISIYPLAGKDYIKLADHFVSISTFDATEVRDWYPYQDFKYKEYGGKSWKKSQSNN